MTKSGRSRKNKLIIILALIVLFVAVICYFFAYKYPIYFLFKDDSFLEYENETYIKYTGNKWTIFFDSDYDELIGFGKNLSWRLYSSSDKNNDFIMLEYRPIITGRAPLPQIYYNENIEFNEPSLENIEYVEIEYYNDDVELNTYKSDDSTLIGELLDLIENREMKHIQYYDDYICEIFFVSSIDDELYYFIAVLEGNDSYYLRDEKQNLITTEPDKLVEILKDISNSEIDLD